ncbi:MAG: UDP-N-acetylmuramate--L-alanine ligase [Marinilabiliaceae bacterium]|nr:UDP-N-acetylmuramate--L-alanine ligase [Marinilabiliaceae bacterium]
MTLNNIKNLFFIGIGGIGMSAIARFFKSKGVFVAGYDLTPSVITDSLQNEGIEIVFSDDENLINNKFRNNETTLVIYTPAIPATHRQLNYFRNNNFNVMKRSEILGIITQKFNAVCIAGTHGKTTISTMTAFLFKESTIGCTAFLGGISKNYQTNFLLDKESKFVVVEADEFDRSFLTLTPLVALISSVDPDHLDIYENKENLHNAFKTFTQKIKPNGCLVIKKELPFELNFDNEINKFTYSLNDKTADFYAHNIKFDGKNYCFDLIVPKNEIKDIRMGVPGLLNVENAVGACALAFLSGVSVEEIQKIMPRFKGIARRFDIHVDTPQLTYIDDYAHHPEEIKAALNSVKQMFPNKRMIVMFQPHLFSRTRDFCIDFAKSLSMADELILTDIYPARELPIEGITSKSIGDLVTKIPVFYCKKENLADFIQVKSNQVFITMGAGDIDREVYKIKNKLVVSG